MPKVLLTGSTGYIGSHTVVALLQAGYTVVGVDNYSRSKPAIADRIRDISQKDYQQYQADLTQKNELAKVLEQESDIS